MRRFFLTLLVSALLCNISAVFAESINLGTAAEYRPFVYYDYNNELTGLDIELIKEIGEREGFTVKFLDMAFDGLIDSVSVGQIDLIGGAFSVTEERKKDLLFSDVYYTNEALIIASVESNVASNLGLNEMTNLRIGVQRGTSFDQWIKTNLVSEGLISTQNVYTFSTLDSAVKGLRNRMIDLLMLDDDSYRQT